MLSSPRGREKREQLLGAEHRAAPALAYLKARLQLLLGWEGRTPLDDCILPVRVPREGIPALALQLAFSLLPTPSFVSEPCPHSHLSSGSCHFPTRGATMAHQRALWPAERVSKHNPSPLCPAHCAHRLLP